MYISLSIYLSIYLYLSLSLYIYIYICNSNKIHEPFLAVQGFSPSPSHS